MSSRALHRVGSIVLVMSMGIMFHHPSRAQTFDVSDTWNAYLVTPGGELRFGLKLDSTDGRLTAQLINGPESSDVPEVIWRSPELTLGMTHYDSRVEARYDPASDTFSGTWRKQRSGGKVAELRFGARRADPKVSVDRSPESVFIGRWGVQFASEQMPAIGIFQHDRQAGLWGTFLTTLGDYRYLTGRVVEGQLELSCFDGGHAMLFRARFDDSSDRKELTGDFWSGDWWHDTWTAHPDENVRLPNAFELTRINKDIPVATLQFPDLDGNLRNVLEEQRQGKPLIIDIFGSWCPNCHDAGKYLAELEQRYGERGLRVVGLAFELTGDFARDVRQVREYQRHHQLRFPVLLGGLSDRDEATRQLQILEHVKAYPTLIFVNRLGEVRAVYTGFNGPATGEAHQRMREQIELLVEQLLDEDIP